MKEIVLSNHADQEGVKTCHVCGGTMLPCTVSGTYTLRAETMIVSNIKAYRCTSCQEIVYSATEAKRIEFALNAKLAGEEGA